MISKSREMDTLRELVAGYELARDNQEPQWEVTQAIVAHAINMVAEYDTSDFPYNLIIKCSPHEDTYVTWNMVSEGATGIWTREQLRAQGKSLAALRRADETGSSQKPSQYGQNGSWESKGFVVEGRWWITREDLVSYVRAVENEDSVLALSYLADTDETPEAAQSRVEAREAMLATRAEEAAAKASETALLAMEETGSFPALLDQGSFGSEQAKAVIAVGEAALATKIRENLAKLPDGEELTQVFEDACAERDANEARKAAAVARHEAAVAERPMPASVGMGEGPGDLSTREGFGVEEDCGE